MSAIVIKNKNELLSHGNKEGRKIALDIIEYAIRIINLYKLRDAIEFALYSKFLESLNNFL